LDSPVGTPWYCWSCRAPVSEGFNQTPGLAKS
jgi:hypothetical protein